MNEFEIIYNSLIGAMRPEDRVPWVEDAFAEGSLCDQAYGEVYDAYERLRERLGVINEDVDVEIIISNMMDIQRDLCARIYSYGRQYDEQMKASLDDTMLRCMEDDRSCMRQPVPWYDAP